jgi:hypothetical protein
MGSVHVSLRLLFRAGYVSRLLDGVSRLSRKEEAVQDTKKAKKKLYLKGGIMYVKAKQREATQCLIIRRHAHSCRSPYSITMQFFCIAGPAAAKAVFIERA